MKHTPFSEETTYGQGLLDDAGLSSTDRATIAATLPALKSALSAQEVIEKARAWQQGGKEGA